MSYDAHFRVWRGDADGGELQDYTVEVNEGEVVLDIIHRLQATQAGDLAVRWNCKAGKCGSCSAEINGRPRLMCMTRMSTFTEDRDHHGHAAAGLPGDARPGDRRVLQLHQGPGDPGLRGARRPRTRATTGWPRSTSSARRSSASASSASCARTPATWSATTRTTRQSFAGPRFLMRMTELDMHPLDSADRARGAGRLRPRLLQHHQVLHRGLPRAHQDHRQRADPDEGARRRPQVRPVVWLGNIIRRRGSLTRSTSSPSDVLEVAPDLLGCSDHARRASRSGSPRSRRTTGDRPRLARLPRADPAQRGDVRRRRPPLRLLHLRHALVRQHRLRAARARPPPSCCARVRSWRARTSRRARRAGVGPAATGPGARPGSRPPWPCGATTAPTCAPAGRSGSAGRPSDRCPPRAVRTGPASRGLRAGGDARGVPLAVLDRRRPERLGVPTGPRRQPRARDAAH